MERMELNEMKYNALEAAIHMNRYLIAKQFCAGKKVLDAACGEGYGTYLLSEWGAEKVYGVDISNEAITHAKKSFTKENAEFICTPVEVLNDLFEDNSFDVIVSLETIEHLNDPTKFLSQVKRLIKPDGIVIISCPNDYYYYPSLEQKNPFHTRKYTLNDFKEITESMLGKSDRILYGVQTNGFINLEENECERLVDNYSKQIDMLAESVRANCLLTEKDETIKDFNVSYYIAIWGVKTDTMIDKIPVLYPHPHDWIYLMDNLKQDVKQNIKHFNNDMDQIKKSYENKIEEFKLEVNQYVDQLHKMNAENQANICEIDNLEQELRKADNKMFELERVINNKSIQLEVAESENILLKSEMSEIKNSNGFKMLLKYYKLRDLFRK